MAVKGTFKLIFAAEIEPLMFLHKSGKWPCCLIN